MKHLFVINPVAGGIRDNIDGLTAKISSAMAERSIALIMRKFDPGTNMQV